MNRLYPIGSIYRNKSLWDKLPRETGIMPDDGLNCIRGFMAAIVIDLAFIALGVSFYLLWRFL